MASKEQKELIKKLQGLGIIKDDKKTTKDAKKAIDKANKGGGSSPRTTPTTVPTPTPPPAVGNSSSASRVSTYTGPSIVDYLSSSGQASDFNSRTKLAQEKGINNYSGTAEQNTQLLNLLRSNTSGGSTPTNNSVVGMGGDKTKVNTPVVTTPTPPTPRSDYATGGGAPVVTPKSTYTGPSVVDYLTSIGSKSDRETRTKLAESLGVQGYMDATGYISGAKNLELLAKLRSGGQANQPEVGADVVIAPVDNIQPENPTAPVVPTGVDPNDYASLVKYASEAGLSVEEFKKLLPNNEVSKEESDKIKKELGIPDLETAVFARTSFSTVDTYNKMYKDSGLEDIKNKIQAIDDEINKTRDQFNEAVSAVNENPWLSESTRVGRVKRLNDQLDAKEANRLEARKQLGDLYDKGVSEIEKTITYATQDFNTNRETNVAKLNYLLKQAEAQEGFLKNKKEGSYNQVVQDFLAEKAGVEGAKDAKPFRVGDETFQYDKTTKTFVKIGGGSSNDTNTEYKKALQFVQDNPDATAKELEQGIRAYTKGLSESDIKSLVTGSNSSNLTRENIANFYGIADDNTKTDTILGLGGTTGKAKIDEVMKTIEKYQKLGYTDDKIMTILTKE